MCNPFRWKHPSSRVPMLVALRGKKILGGQGAESNLRGSKRTHIPGDSGKVEERKTFNGHALQICSQEHWRSSIPQ